MSSPFAALPSELILSVFSFAAQHHPTALSLSLVSSWVHTHVEAALYHTVHLQSSRALASFISTLDSKPDTFTKEAVKKLCITALGPMSSIETVLSRCTGVMSLACGFSVPSYVHCVKDVPLPQDNSKSTIKLPIAPKEQHLLTLACRDGLDMSIISPAVTHLRIQLTPATTYDSLARLAELRDLTHLAVVYKQVLLGGLDAIKEMLRPVMEKGRLRVLVLEVAGAGVTHLEEIRKWSEEIQLSFPRTFKGHPTIMQQGLIIAGERAPRSILSQWEDSEGFWRDAEAAGSVRA
ncbi:hypothetical protein HYDPIDRAFT_107344 [Hydnomerulius pinastri MD-312]|nr:hypothetical protein HYDPIDRAFT_107344 [Hydnomerulius pinastri MD-312]